MITARAIKDLSGLDTLDRIIPGRASKMAQKMAEDARDIVRAHWSSTSPSPPGQPPAVVSGRLDASIEVDSSSEGGGGVLGLLGGKSKYYFAVRAEAKHGMFQELGTVKMEARPFLAPAVEIVASRVGDYAKTVFEMWAG